MCLFLGFKSVSLVTMPVFMTITCFYYYNFIINSEIKKYKASRFVIFFFFFIYVTLASQSLLWFHMNFRVVSFISVKNAFVIWVRIASTL